MAQNHLRAPAEHGFASLKTFRILTQVRMHPRHATALVRALLVLTHHQVARRPMISPQ